MSFCPSCGVDLNLAVKHPDLVEAVNFCPSCGAGLKEANKNNYKLTERTLEEKKEEPPSDPIGAFFRPDLDGFDEEHKETESEGNQVIETKLNPKVRNLFVTVIVFAVLVWIISPYL